MSDDQFLSPDQRFQMDYMEMQTMREPPCPTCGQELPTTDYYLRQTEQPPTTAGTWAPDEEQLARVTQLACDEPLAEKSRADRIAERVIEAYERQVAAAGWVLARQNQLLNAFTLIEDVLPTVESLALADHEADFILTGLTEAQQQIKQALAATPGGDER